MNSFVNPDLSVSSSDTTMLIPQPQETRIANRRVQMFAATVVDHFSDLLPIFRIQERQAARQVVLFLAQEIITTVEEQTGIAWHCGSSLMAEQRGAGIVKLGFSSQIPEDGYSIKVIPAETGHEGDASYFAAPVDGEGAGKIADRGIISVQASSVPGLRAGIQTLRQLIRDNGLSLPMLTISGKPSFSTRAYVLDVTRGRVPTMQWLRHWVDMLELYQYNQLQLYVEDVFAFVGFEEEWWDRSPLTPEQIRELDGYCAERGIELVPCLSTFGHMYTLLRTTRYARFSEFPDDARRPFSFIERQEHHTLNIEYPGVFDLVVQRLEQYMPLFQSRKFNICGDETFDLGKGASKKMAEDEGVHHMYARFVSQLTTYLRNKGYQPLMWGDVVLQRPSVVHEIDGEPIYLNWQYAPLVTASSVRTLARQGVPQWVCSATHTWNTLFPLIDDSWNNSARLAIFGAENDCDGFVLTDWGDYGHVNDPHLAIPALLIGAECAWNARNWSRSHRSQIISADNSHAQLDHSSALLASIKRRITHVLFHDDDNFLSLLSEKGNVPSAFSWGDVIRYKELDDGAGRLNSDVAQSMVWMYREYEAIPRAMSLEEARVLLLKPLRARLQKSVRQESAVSSVSRLLAHTKLDKGMTQALLVTAQGQDLLDAFGRRICGVSEPHVYLQGEKLSDNLEEWFQEYEALWKETSRQGQLNAIHDVIAFMVATIQTLTEEN